MTINHGANLFDLSSKLGLKKSEILDFSSNVNPFGASKKAKNSLITNVDMVSMYPDPEYKELKGVISEYCSCNFEDILLGSGATELISAFIDSINPKKALLISPAYSEYERSLKRIGCEIVKYFAKKELEFKIDLNDLKKEIKKGEYDLVVICNPNNPTGFAFEKEEIKELLKYTKTFFMVDETYVEFTDTSKYSATHLVDKYKNIFVIRGTSKFFSTPGIRLGYGLISNEEIKEKISHKLDLWNINIFADLMGEIMFKDKEYIENTISYMTEERKYLYDRLREINSLNVYESKGNFILCEIKESDITAKDLYDELLKEGIVIRNCSSFEGLSDKFFRVCILKHEENELLIQEIKKIFK